MSSEVAITRYLIDLDCILDFRYAAFQQLPPPWNELQPTAQYTERKSDNFEKEWPGFPQVQWEDLWKNPTAEFFSRPLYMTYIVEELAEIIHDASLGDTPTTRNVSEVAINLYPFSFTPAQALQLKKDIANSIGVPITKLVFITKELSELTPKYLRKEEYHFYYLYSFDRWITEHITDLKISPCPSTTFLCPRLAIADDGDNMLSTGQVDKAINHQLAGTTRMGTLPAYRFSIYQTD